MGLNLQNSRRLSFKRYHLDQKDEYVKYVCVRWWGILERGDGTVRASKPGKAWTLLARVSESL